MMATGGRAHYGLGSKLKKAIKKVGNVVKDIADPVAQALAVIPNPYQPYAQAYTGIRAAGIGGDDYSGLQVGGFTPGAYGGKYGIDPFSTTTFPGAIEGIGGATQARRFYDDSYITNPPGQIKKQIEGPYVYGGYDPAGTQTNWPSDNRPWYQKQDILGKIITGVLGKEGERIVPTAAGSAAAYLAYKDQQRKNELIEKAYEDYIAGRAAATERFADKSKLRGYTITGKPTSVRDVVRAGAMGGGIMSSRIGYDSGSEDLEYKGWKRIYLKSNDAAESHPRHSEFIKRFAEETMGQDRSPEVRIKKALGGMGMEKPISSFEENTMMAGPDWYVKRVEILMELGYDYDTASEIAYDSDRYYDTVGGMNKGGRPGYAMGDTATMAAQVEGLPLRNNQAGITELDLRDSGGFIPPVGIKEKADDIPAMLSNNEFVFTADAVRGMGDGDVDVGAQRMYNIMKRLEKGGRV
jgi:hypothetical protein